MTGLGPQTGSPGKKGAQLSKQEQTKSKTSFQSHGSSKNIGGKNDMEQMQNIEKNMQLDDEYEDDDFNVYFDKPSLLNRLNELEEENLFRITEL